MHQNVQRLMTILIELFVQKHEVRMLLHSCSVPSRRTRTSTEMEVTPFSTSLRHFQYLW